MYGPPPDPRQVALDGSLSGAPLAWLACIALGGLLAWRAGPLAPHPGRRYLALLGLTIALTSPAAGMLAQGWWGDFPTIDKTGSLLFFREGVQWRILDASDPGLRLIGVHVGHLWPTSLLALALPEHAAFGAQHLLQLAAAWWAAAGLLEALAGDRRVAVICAAPFALNLHQLRDIKWYTIEKTEIFWISIFAWILVEATHATDTPRVRRLAGLAALTLLGASLTNLYVAMTCAGLGALALLTRSRTLALVVGAGALGALPAAVQQLRLLAGPGTLGTPAAFLEARAALDVVEVWPPRWNRLEAWAVLDPGMVLLAGVGMSLALRRSGAGPSGAAIHGAEGVPSATPPPSRGVPPSGRSTDLAIVGSASVFFLLSLGPYLDAPGGLPNPVYRALLVVPGLWRIAKPEGFFHVTWLCTLALAARGLVRVGPTPRRLLLVIAVSLAAWVFLARSHPAAPGFSRDVPVALPRDWQRGAFTTPPPTPAPPAPTFP